MGLALALAGLAGGFLLLAAVVTRYAIVAWPDEGELAASGEETPAEAQTAAVAIDGRLWTYRQLAADRTFWLVALGCSLLLANFFAIAVTLAPALLDSGASIHAAAFMVSALTGSAVVGKLVTGFLSERLSAKLLLIGVAAAHLTILALLFMQPGYWVMAAGILIIGIGIGGVSPLQAALIANHFGRRSFGTVLGLMGLIYQPFSILSTQLVARVRDHAGSYGPAFASLMAGVVVAALLLAFLPQSETAARSITPEPSHA